MNAAIVVVVGGFGKQVGIKVNQLLRASVASAGDIDAARMMASQVHLIAVDSFAQADHDEFGAGGVILMPRTPYFIDSQIESLWMEEGDPFFREWFPAAGNRPLRIGDYDHGDGRNRIKSKMGYRFALMQGNGNLADLVMNRVQQINNALGPAAHHDDTRVPIYIVASLGGGAGSGKALIAAEHLRSVLPATCRIVGVFALPDITQILVGEGEKPFIWANACAALAEIDYFQLPAYQRARQIAPFFRWPAIGGVIEGDQPAFDYVYLFGAQRQGGTFLPAYSDYVRLVAECLATEVFEPVSANIDDPHAQFVQAIGDNPVHNTRSWTYASAGVASLVYPVDRVEMHLSRRWVADTLTDSLLADNRTRQTQLAAGASAADQLLQDNGLLPIDNLLRQLVTANPGEPALPNPPRLSGEPGPFLDADRDGATQLIRGTCDVMERWLSESHRPFVQGHAAELVNRFRGGAILSCSNGSIAAAIEAELARGTTESFVRTEGMIARFKDQMETSYAAVMTELYGPNWQTAQDGGLTNNSTTHRNQLGDKVREMREGFGPLSRRGRNAKQAFIQQWWNPYDRRSRRITQLEAASTVYSELKSTLEHIDQVMNTLVRQVRTLADEAAAAAASDLGSREQGAVLEQGVLATAELVDTHFHEVHMQSVAQHRDDLLGQLLAAAGDKSGLRTMMRDEIERVAHGWPLPDDYMSKARQQMLSRAVIFGESLFSQAVRQLSVWDAAAIECDLRQRLNLIDIPLQKALDAGERRTAALLGEGLVDAGIDAYLRERYIEENLEAVARRAVPSWSLDPAIRNAHDGQLPGRPFQITVLACDQAVYQAFLARTGAEGFLDGIEARLGVRQSDRPGRFAVTVYTRQGGVPLFYLDAKMRETMQSAAGHVRRTHLLFTDKRFEGVLTGDLNPPRPPLERARIAIGGAVHLGLVELTPTQTVFHLNGTDETTSLTDIQELQRELAENQPALMKLEDAVNSRLQDLSPSDYTRAVRAIAKCSQDRAMTIGATDRQWWEETARTVERRLLKNGH